MATSQPFRNKETAAAFCDANKAFMMSLLKELPQASNVFYSPFSISTALAMVHLGARTDTLKEMDQVLHFDKMGKETHSAFGGYLEYLSKETGDITLKTANKIYQSMRFKPEETFIKECKKHFKTTAESMDFSQSAEASSKINFWVSQQTKNKIQNLVPADALDALTFMVLINAIYFKGNWKSKFQSKNTRKMEFRNEKGNFMTDMMYQKASFRFCHLPDMQINALDIPYEGDKLSMLVLLPMAVDGLNDLEEKLSERFLNGVISHLRKQKVEVHLPKFKLESMFELGPHLSALGMSSAFDENKADFSGIDNSKNVYINEVFHKAFVEVNEEGSEAVAATADKIRRKRCVQITQEFRANHPFLFFIRDSVNDVILFSGRFYQPV
ncbi:leukocyte elastase inhibitor-like [Crassostrea angulata]|uniref:leukocyte elastase inhibitor-like n=1 Tax=Magallana angulata TaxID=2784310 RepID=UPI0022B08840|nr:leukocyte elastase inhibitor-like [Crassostrea angulata]XP_052678570.1 leukocyte elastase inhibitor-like [Crassostrea angulata]